VWVRQSLKEWAMLWSSQGLAMLWLDDWVLLWFEDCVLLWLEDWVMLWL
jgi:hypothetical protein